VEGEKVSNKVFFVDTERCIACGSCEAACAREHDGTTRIFVTTISDKYALPLCCLHCDNSPCVEVCPTHALEKVPQSAVTFHKVRCIGCGLCIFACPFGVIQLRDENTILKCDRCITRLKQGKNPVCILTCPTKALAYDKSDSIAGARRKKKAYKAKRKKS
jgi:Fe-S-cluster-containing dehydrogenase component